jgi:hypothetical protein
MLSMIDLFVYLLDLHFSVICLNVYPLSIIGIVGYMCVFLICAKVRVMVFNATFNSISVIY